MRVRIFSVLPGAALALALGWILVASPSEMRADTLFTNFAPGPVYSGVSWWETGTTTNPPPGTEVNAFSFMPTATGTVTGADLALSGLAPPTGASGPAALNVYIESNSATGTPGMILDTLTQVGSIPAYTVTSVVNFTCSGTCTTLDAGTTYWIVGQESVAADTVYWMWNTTGDTGTWYVNLANSPTGSWTVAASPLPHGNTFGAFDVTGTLSAVPEPASLALFGSGLLGMMTVVRRRTSRRSESAS